MATTVRVLVAETVPVTVTEPQGVEEALRVDTKEAELAAVSDVIPVVDTDRLAETEGEGLTEGEADRDGDAELRMVSEGDWVAEKHPEEDREGDTVGEKVSARWGEGVRTAVPDTLLLLECVLLALTVGDTEDFAVRVAVLQAVSLGVQAADRVELCESDRDPV